jgi:hypothetical protein
VYERGGRGRSLGNHAGVAIFGGYSHFGRPGASGLEPPVRRGEFTIEPGRFPPSVHEASKRPATEMSRRRAEPMIEVGMERT